MILYAIPSILFCNRGNAACHMHGIRGTGSCTVEAVVRVFTEFKIYYILMGCNKNGLAAEIKGDWKLSIKLATL